MPPAPDIAILTKFASLICSGKLDEIKTSLANLSFQNQVVYNNSPLPFADGLIAFYRLEKNYHTLHIFPIKSLFSRKEDYASSYHALQTSFELLGNGIYLSPRHAEYRTAFWIANMCYVRRALIILYRSLASNPLKLLKNLDSIRSEIGDLRQSLTLSDDEVEHALSPYITVIRAELTIISTLLQIQTWIADLKYIDPLSAFFVVSSELKILYTNFCPHGSSSRVRTLRRHSSTELPPLVNWLTGFYQCLLAKYSLYWFKIIHHSVLDNSLVFDVIDQESPSLVNDIMKFQRVGNAIYASVFFDTSSQEYPFLGHGYVVRGKSGKSPQGVESIPSIFTSPLGYEIPAPELSTIIVLIQSLMTDEVGKSVYSFDTRLSRTFFARKLEFRFYLALVFQGHRAPEDKQITKFADCLFNDISLQTVCSTLQSR